MAVCIDAQGPTLDEILLRHGLKVTDLETLCPLEVRNEVAVLIKDWEMVGHCFNFPPEKIRDIDRESGSQDQCKVALLDTWSKREGKGATYLKLADVFHRRKRRDLVELLCEKVKSSMRFVPLFGAPDTSWDMASTVRPRPVSITKGYTDDVSSQIESLEEQFDDIHDRLVAELTEGGVSVERVLQALTKLPFAFRKQYQDAIQNMLPNLETKDRISSLFHLLNPLFTFIDYELLKHLVSKFGSSKLKEDMSSYVEKAQLFKKATTVSELIEYWPGLEVPESNYSRLRAKIDDDPGTFTLEELDNFRRKFFSHLRLSDFVSVSILMLLEHTSSFVVIWLISTAVVPELMEAFSCSEIDNMFCQVEHILELSVDERTLYQKNVQLESMNVTSVDESVNMASVSASTHVDIPSQHTEDTLYSLLVFSQYVSSGYYSTINYDVSITAYVSGNTFLKFLKQNRTRRGVRMMMERFKFNKNDCDPCLKVLPKGDVRIESGDGMIRPSDIWRESQLEDMDRYHLKLMMPYYYLCSGSIEFQGTTDDTQLKITLSDDGIPSKFCAMGIVGSFCIIDSETNTYMYRIPSILRLAQPHRN